MLDSYLLFFGSVETYHSELNDTQLLTSLYIQQSVLTHTTFQIVASKRGEDRDVWVGYITIGATKKADAHSKSGVEKNVAASFRLSVRGRELLVEERRRPFPHRRPRGRQDEI